MTPVLLGVRHHGPGSARAVAAALAAVRPDAILVEGPPEAGRIVAYAADPAMRPPVALLVHALDDPAQAGFWPYADFSPEWAALRYALARQVPVSFADLPVGCVFGADRAARDAWASPAPGGAAGRSAARPADRTGVTRAAGSGTARGGTPAGEGARTGDDRSPSGPATGAADDPGPAPAAPGPGTPDPRVVDPIAVLARLAGHDDPERWWEDVVEHRLDHPGDRPGDALAPFAALAEAMTQLRAGTLGSPSGPGANGLPDLEDAREAAMRQAIRAARRAGHRRVAVVCGAWHVPALDPDLTTAAADRALLAPLTRPGVRVRVGATWVPWTYRRLAAAGGYGAGVEAPGWYHHLRASASRPREELLPAWFTHVAALLRDAGRPVSPAHVIEATRHAEALAALRGRPLPGLAETLDAVRAVMCDGDDGPLELVRDAVVVGDRVGRVPDGVPATPLQRDLAREQRRLRLRPSAGERLLDLDLRTPVGAARSRLLGRLALLDVSWGVPVAGPRGSGTFRETWRLAWQPELAIHVAEAAVWGTTVEAAATARAIDRARAAGTPAQVARVAERCLHAGLPGALPEVLRELERRAARAADVTHLAEALPGVVRALRYGDVRGTPVAGLAAVAAVLLTRVALGLDRACHGLDADGAKVMRRHLDAVHDAVGLLQARAAGAGPGTAREAAGAGSGTAPDVTSGAGPAAAGDGPDTAAAVGRWYRALTGLADRPGAPGLLAGRATRLLVDAGRIGRDDAAARLARVLTPGVAPRDAAAWTEGFLDAGGLLLVHDDALLALVDAWITGIPAEAFTAVLPLLRRTFAAFDPPDRRALGERVAARPGRPAAADPPGLDLARADAALPVLMTILGRKSS